MVTGLSVVQLGLYSYDWLGSLSNGDGDDDGNENVKEAIGLDWQNDSFAHASRFFLHFFAVVARLRRELPNFNF